MKIKEHGHWTIYRPSEKVRVDKGWPAGTICCKSGSTDWYDYQKKLEGLVIATVYQVDGEWQIGTVDDDVSKIFPGNGLVIEIDGYKGKLEDLYTTPYDPKAKKLLDKPKREQGPSPREMANEIAELKEQVAALLKKK